MNAGHAIRFCRQQKSLSIPALAEKVGLSTSYISLLERNERDPPLSTLQKISAALEVPLSVLVFIGTAPAELETLSPEIVEKLSAATMKLLRATSDAFPATDDAQRTFL
jgi:transcriptional regulator with XRE-family HTH domain